MDYLSKLVPLLLDVPQEQFSTVIKTEESLKKLERFARDNKIPVIFISKMNDLDEVTKTQRVDINLDVSFTKTNVNNLAIIKRSPETLLEKSKSLSSQLQLISIGEEMT